MYRIDTSLPVDITLTQNICPSKGRVIVIPRQNPKLEGQPLFISFLKIIILEKYNFSKNI
jgi:hypothetical protein